MRQTNEYTTNARLRTNLSNTEYGQNSITGKQVTEALDGIDLRRIDQAINSVDLITIADNEVTITFPGESKQFRIEKLENGTLSTDWATNVELPDPSRRNDNHPEYANLRIKNQLESTMQRIAAVDILIQMDVPDINESNINVVIRSMRATEPPHPIMSRLRGTNIIIDVENAIRELMDDSAYTRSKNVRGKVPIGRYNRVFRGGEAVQTIQESSPMVGSWIATRRDDASSYAHPGEVMNRVRDDLMEAGLNQSSWKQTSKIDPQTVEYIVRGSVSRPAIAMVFNAMAKYQIKDPSPERIRDARDLADRYRFAGMLNPRNVEDEGK